MAYLLTCILLEKMLKNRLVLLNASSKLAWACTLCSNLLDMLMKTFPSHVDVGHVYILHIFITCPSFNSLHVEFVSKAVHVSQ